MKAKVYFTRTITPDKVVEAYEKLGVEGVRRLNYHLSNIRREILRQ